jgi:hypothetical protein
LAAIPPITSVSSETQARAIGTTRVLRLYIVSVRDPLAQKPSPSSKNRTTSRAINEAAGSMAG